jgi:hypothetical protein
MMVGDFAEDTPEIRRHRQVPSIFQVLDSQHGHFSMYPPAGHLIAQDKITGAPPVVRPPRSILMYRPAEFGHGHHRYLILVGGEIPPKGRDAIAEIGCITRKNTIVRTLVEMSIPTGRLGKGYFQPYLHFDKLRYLF